jgi:hypothetical protein
MTTDPLTTVLDAHGGLDRWRQFNRVEATIVAGACCSNSKACRRIRRRGE